MRNRNTFPVLTEFTEFGNVVFEGWHLFEYYFGGVLVPRCGMLRIKCAIQFEICEEVTRVRSWLYLVLGFGYAVNAV